MNKKSLSSRLKKRINIKKKCNLKNSFGEVEETFEAVKSVYAEVRPVTGRSFFSAQHINSEITHQVLIRYTQGIRSSMFIQYSDRMFEILYVMNYNESNEAILLMCKELC